MARTDRQINVRLPPTRYAVLEAAAFVRNKGTPGKLVEEIVEDAIERYEKAPAVRKALEARTEQAAEDEGKLSRLPRVRSVKRSGSK